MSRSYKLAILKDKGLKEYYWKKARRVTKQAVQRFLKEDPDDVQLPHTKSIINDYDYSDYTIDYEYDKSSSYFWYNGNHDYKYTIKARRK